MCDIPLASVYRVSTHGATNKFIHVNAVSFPGNIDDIPVTNLYTVECSQYSTEEGVTSNEKNVFAHRLNLLAIRRLKSRLDVWAEQHGYNKFRDYAVEEYHKALNLWLDEDHLIYRSRLTSDTAWIVISDIEIDVAAIAGYRFNINNRQVSLEIHFHSGGTLPIDIKVSVSKLLYKNTLVWVYNQSIFTEVGTALGLSSDIPMLNAKDDDDTNTTVCNKIKTFLDANVENLSFRQRL